MTRTISLCGEGKCCPTVIMEKDAVTIGETGNLAMLKKEEWNSLVDLIKSEELGRI